MKKYQQFISELKAALSKKLWVFDFDDTLVVSKGKIGIRNEKGELLRHVGSEAFKTNKLKAGESYDFSDFSNSSEADPIRHWMSALRKIQKTKGSYMILTARASSSGVRKWLESQGIRHPHIVAVGSRNLHRVGGGGPSDIAAEKKRVVKQAINRLGYTEVVVVDDSHQNIKDIESIHGKNNPDSPIRTIIARGKADKSPLQARQKIRSGEGNRTMRSVVGKVEQPKATPTP